MDQILIGFVGLVIGFVIGEIRDWFREGRQADSLRSLLTQEIDHNLKLLQEIWDTIPVKQKDMERAIGNDPELNQQEIDNRVSVELANYLIKLPNLIWHRNVWDSQTYLISRALSKVEIQKVHQLFSRLETLTDMRLKIVKLESEKDARRLSQFANAPNQMAPYISYASAMKGYSQEQAWLWNESKSIISDTLNDGNPLREDG